MSGSYIIPLSGSSEGRCTYDFVIDRKFFELFEESEIKEGNLIIFVEVDKRSSHIDLDLKIKGNVSICCDRCLEMFDHPVDCENRLLVKYGRIRDDSDPDIITITVDQHELDIKQYIYEFIHLSLPIQRIHPEDASGNSNCNPAMLKKLDEHIIREDSYSDSRWDKLKMLLNDN